MEPFLTDPFPVIDDVNGLVTQIWIGIMNKLPSRSIFHEDVSKEKDLMLELRRLKALYSKSNLSSLIAELRNNPKIFWKTSIIERALGITISKNERKKKP
jgi:hypothetical protein